MTTRDVQSTVATSQHTVNYDLPLWNGTDITSWQGNLNDAFNKIDTAMFENKTAMLGYQEIADKLEETNDSTVELVNQVNSQLTEINEKYDEVKEGLEAANNLINEANQAILALQQEDESVKVQMDTMQDDIGKLMEWHTGVEVDTGDIELPAESDDTPSGMHVTGVNFIGGCALFRVVVPVGNCDAYIPLENMQTIATALGLDLEHVTVYGVSSWNQVGNVECIAIGKGVNGYNLIRFNSHSSALSNQTIRVPVWWMQRK